MGTFQPWTEHEIRNATDERLLTHIRTANAHGRPDHGSQVCGRLLDRYEGIIKAKARNKIPEVDVTNVVQEVHLQVTRAIYSDKPIDVVKAYVVGIASNVVASYYRDREGEPELAPLPSEHERDEESWLHERGNVESGYEEVESRLEADSARGVLDGVLASRSEAHRFVVETFVLGDPDTSARAVVDAANAAGHTVTEQNVYKIKERFLTDYEAALVADGFGGAPEMPSDERRGELR